MLLEIEGQPELNTREEKGRIKIDWGRQGGLIAGYVVVLLGYYGIISNLVMYNQYGKGLSFLDITVDELRISISYIYETSVGEVVYITPKLSCRDAPMPEIFIQSPYIICC